MGSLLTAASLKDVPTLILKSKEVIWWELFIKTNRNPVNNHHHIIKNMMTYAWSSDKDSSQSCSIFFAFNFLRWIKIPLPSREGYYSEGFLTDRIFSETRDVLSSSSSSFMSSWWVWKGVTLLKSPKSTVTDTFSLIHFPQQHPPDVPCVIHVHIC